jgi:hypothetical protein
MRLFAHLQREFAKMRLLASVGVSVSPHIIGLEPLNIYLLNLILGRYSRIRRYTEILFKIREYRTLSWRPIFHSCANLECNSLNIHRKETYLKRKIWSTYFMPYTRFSLSFVVFVLINITEEKRENCSSLLSFVTYLLCLRNDIKFHFAAQNRKNCACTVPLMENLLLNSAQRPHLSWTEAPNSPVRLLALQLCRRSCRPGTAISIVRYEVLTAVNMKIPVF